MTDTTTIRVGQRPAAFGAEAVFFDGDTATPHAARFRIEESSRTLVIEYAGKQALWPLDEIRRLPDQAQAKELVLAKAGDPVARLITQEIGLAKRCPNLARRNSHVKRRRVVSWAIGAVASVALIIFVLVPTMADQLAEFIPPEGEQALGEATFNQIRSALDETGVGGVPVCNHTGGRHALAIIQARLESSVELPTDLNIYVLDHPMVNAFALPGGTIVFFDGLIQAAETPEELAAVFAHEIGHVVSRDPTRHALRSAGSIGVLGLLLGDFAGGAAVLLLTERLIEANYSQSAETAADILALDLLEKAAIPPGSLGTMFKTFQDKHGDTAGFASHFLSHPMLSERIVRAEKAQQEALERGFQQTPLLRQKDWVNLKGICGFDPA